MLILEINFELSVVNVDPEWINCEVCHWDRQSCTHYSIIILAQHNIVEGEGATGTSMTVILLGTGWLLLSTPFYVAQSLFVLDNTWAPVITLFRLPELICLILVKSVHGHQGTYRALNAFASSKALHIALSSPSFCLCRENSTNYLFSS